MSYRNILVHVDRGARRGERIELAFHLAANFDAHLIALYALSKSRIPVYALSPPAEAILEAVENHLGASCREAQAEFDASRKRHFNVRTEWRFSEEDAAAALAVNERYADLVLVGQHDPYSDADAGTDPRLVESVVMEATRPVLVVPYAGRFRTVGRKVLIAWNASAQAARAVGAALPLLRQADDVQVCVFDPEKSRDEHGEEPGADLAAYLARHGVKACVTRQASPYGDVGCGILSRAADFGSDLIVMGAYGRTRTSERLLGGATRTLLESMTVPVMLAH